ncbi:C2H2 type zinc-finger-domain-containing protein [Staphylotrichum tortipilum]|uniref:C2H2 type zinc-finger-domain-containing protein n=1 Tax=Staphylotrichum tortipilum TaxID=2831512 RepID=A0AAN6RW79_9PEZI|nr:C2H2 type zinc-finger-domain-containing protein [Staphylotrichum longicolle]
MEAPASDPAPVVASAPNKALLQCHICELSFETPEDKRQHAKSEWHVYKIRCRVAEPGTVVTPPDSDPKPSTRRPKKPQGRKSPSRTRSKSRSKSPQVDEESYDESESESDAPSDKETLEFVPGECLFCNQASTNFDANLAHMHQAHSLVVPFQDALVVDLQTVVWFLHMVIASYRECICCGTRRRTVEAVQQHMTSTGHCRFTVTDEMSGFYDPDALPSQQTTETLSNPDDRTLRLASGKILAHRSDPNSTNKPREKTQPSTAASPLPASSQEFPTDSHPADEANPQALTKLDRKEQALTKHLAQLRVGDRLSLARLSAPQQRALLVVHKKGLDEAKRAERRTRGRVDNVGNKMAVHTKYYKQEVPVYMGG